MNATRDLHEIGQSLWLDNITRAMLNDGTLESYVHDYSVTGLTSNPAIFDKAIEQSDEYDDSIKEAVGRGLRGEDLFFELAIQDLQRAADLFRPTYERTDGVDGWASLEVSPLLAYDADGTTKQAAALYERARRDNVFIKIPGTAEGARAIEESVFADETAPFLPHRMLRRRTRGRRSGAPRQSPNRRRRRANQAVCGPPSIDLWKTADAFIPVQSGHVANTP
jgi:transaldolase